MRAELDPRPASNLPMLPPKRIFYNKEKQFLEDRMHGLNDYLKSVITLHEAIEHPSVQRFLEIDTNYNPNYEYESIQPQKSLHAQAKPTTSLPKSGFNVDIRYRRLRMVTSGEDLDLDHGSSSEDENEEEPKREDTKEGEPVLEPKHSTEEEKAKCYRHKGAGALQKKLEAYIS